jgi:hypothetical protein
MPWGALDGLPLFDSLVPTRLALVVTPVVGCLLADRGAPVRPAGDGAGRPGACDRSAGGGLLVLALMLGPLIPTPLPASARPPVQWQTATGLDFTIVGGYFLAPDRTGGFGPIYPPTLSMLLDVAEQGMSIKVTATLRAGAVADFRNLGVTTIVLPAGHPMATELRRVVDGLAGPGRLVADVWIWDVRYSMVAAP